MAAPLLAVLLLLLRARLRWSQRPPAAPAGVDVDAVVLLRLAAKKRSP